jgi:alkylation response protein AidB-like acyl-CoA dehydrogenase
MNFDLNDEQQLLADTIKRFVATHYNFDARAKIVSSQAGHSEDIWAAVAEMGLLGLPFGTEYGGFGGSNCHHKEDKNLAIELI